MSTIPAIQLGSVAARYDQAARIWPTSAGGGVADLAFWPTARPAAAAASGPAAREEPLARLEAVLFVAGGSLSSRKLAQFAGLADGTRARTLVRQLNELYDRQGSAFRVEEVAGGFQLLSRPALGPWLRRLHDSPVEVRLSTPAMETLAVVAYRQPVLRAELESIRGVQCGEMIRQLSERDLVRIVGRSPELGRPFLYGTTKRFLQVFGLKSLDELPRSEYLRESPKTSKNSNKPTESTDRQQESEEVKIAVLTVDGQQPNEADLELQEQPSESTTAEPRADAELEDEEDGDEWEDDDDDDEEDLDDYDDDDDDLDDDWEEVEDDDLDEDEWEEDDDDWEEDEEEEEDWEK